MNRLAPLIARRAGPLAIVVASEAALPAPDPVLAYFDDLKLFAMGWLGGLVFFGTLFG